MKSNNFEPLRVIAWFQCGIVCDAYLPLDGILLYQAMRERHGARDTTMPGQAVPGVKLDATMPLLIKNHGTERWYYACSFAQPQPWWSAEGKDHWNKRFDQSFAHLVDFGKRRGKVIVEQGQYRAYHMPVFYRVARKMEWYCVGDREAIEYLLAPVTHIGKKADQGWGRVVRWQVEPWPEDWSEQREGMVTRSIPVNGAASFSPIDNVRLYGLRPPYWLPKNQTRCLMPPRSDTASELTIDTAGGDVL